MRALWTVLALATLSLTACSGEREYRPRDPGDPETSSETHWLQACDEDAECGSGLACVCKICTLSCASDGECDGMAGVCSGAGGGGYDALCDSPDPLPAGICLPGCGELGGGACGEFSQESGKATWCLDASCVPDSRVPRPSKVDLLWVVDNSGSMCEEQKALRDQVGTFVERLRNERIDFQMGVVTTDMVAATQSGRLQNEPQGEPGPGCTISVDVEGCASDLPLLVRSQDLRYQDDPQSLGVDFGCMATVGTRGYGFEMGLEAMRAALSPALLEGVNAGLLRDDSLLVVVFVTDENDCSDGGVLDKTNGNVCEWERDQLINVSEYVTLLEGIRPGRVLVGGITAPDDGTRYNFGEEVLPSCISEAGEGYSGYRYHELIDAFEGGVNRSICSPDGFQSALDALGARIVATLK